MKCPFRKITIKSPNEDHIEERFAECYEESCPFYHTDMFGNNEGCVAAERLKKEGKV